MLPDLGYSFVFGCSLFEIMGYVDQRFQDLSAGLSVCLCRDRIIWHSSYGRAFGFCVVCVFISKPRFWLICTSVLGECCAVAV